jgi:ribosomal protein L12E/L44/L45/RPP1/RPP2
LDGGVTNPIIVLASTSRRAEMRKLLALIVAGLFAVATGAVFAASHAGAKIDDKEKKTDTKKTDGKKEEEKKAEPKK